MIDAHELMLGIWEPDKAPAKIEPRYGYWMDCGSLSCRCSRCGCKSRSPEPVCRCCGAIMEESEADDGETGGLTEEF